MAIEFQSFKEGSRAGDESDISIYKPNDTARYNLMIAAIITDGSTTPSCAGWTPIQIQSNAAVTLYTFYKIAGVSEPGSYVWRWSGLEEAYGFIMRFTGHNTSTPINASSLTSGISANPTCPSITTDRDDCLILRIFGADDNDINIDGVPTGYPDGTAGITLDDSSTTGGTCSGGAAYLAQTSTGISGIAEFALTASEQWIGITIAIQQAGAGSPSVSPSESPSASPSASLSPSASESPSVSFSGSPSASPSLSLSPSASVSPSVSPSSSVSPSVSPSVSLSLSPSASVSPSPSSSVSPSVSLSISPSSSPSPSESASTSFSGSASPSPTPGDVDTYGLPAYETGGTAQLVTNEFKNLGHLIGEEVTVIGTDVDDVTTVFDDEIVDSEGDINITSEDPHAHNFVKKARVGLRYRYILKPMRMDLMTQEGTTKGSIKKFAEVVVSFHKTLGAKQGKDTSNLHTITDFGSTLFTGDVVVSTDGGYGVEDDFVISGNAPLPCVVRAIVPRVKKIGR